MKMFMADGELDVCMLKDFGFCLKGGIKYIFLIEVFILEFLILGQKFSS